MKMPVFKFMRFLVSVLCTQIFRLLFKFAIRRRDKFSSAHSDFRRHFARLSTVNPIGVKFTTAFYLTLRDPPLYGAKPNLRQI
ncbi:MAG: hypothetical protein D8H92_10405 [Campylobacter sp.]|nr:MAG: hypothetical protein D8H92_10405 [Campylobacter sp.]